MSDDDLRDRLAAAMDEHFNPDQYPVMAAMFRDYADVVLPIVRQAQAQALRDAAEVVHIDAPGVKGCDPWCHQADATTLRLRADQIEESPDA